MDRRLLLALPVVLLLAAALGIHRVKAAPKRAFERGLNALYRGQYAGAVREFGSALKSDPENPRAHYFRGLAYKELRKLPEAATDLGRALELDPSLVGAAYQRALARRELGDPAGALSDLDQAIAAHAGEPALFYARAKTLLDQGREALAEKDFDAALARQPEFPAALAGRGELRLRRLAKAQALGDYDKAVALDRGYAPAYLGRADAHFSFGRDHYPQCFRDLEQALKINPKSIQTLRRRAGIYLALNDFESAVADLTRAIGLNPRGQGLYFERGTAAQGWSISRDDRGLADRSIRDLSKAVELSPKWIAPYVMRAHVRAPMLLDFEGARADLKAASRLNPKDAGVYDELCTLGMLEQRLKDALQSCNRAVDLSPKQKRNYITRCRVLNRLGDPREALKDCERALALDPFDEGAYMVRGEVREKLGDTRLALEDFERTVELNPHRRKTLEETLARLRAKVGGRR